MSELKQQLSALMDGEADLNGHPQLDKALQSDEIMQSWATYHLIGDVLRGDGAMRPKVTAQTMQRLQREPVVLAPKRRIDQFNQWVSHRYVTSMAASVAAVAFVGWAVWQVQGGNGLAGLQANQSGPRLAQQDAHQNSALAAEAFDRYLLAHHEYASGSAMQYSSDVKTVSYSESAN